MPKKREAVSMGPDGDALDYQMAIEDVYNVSVVLLLRPSKARVHWGWTIEAKAYQTSEDAPRKMITFALATYPTVAHRTFAGAILGALFGLEDRLRAYTTLVEMGDTP